MTTDCTMEIVPALNPEVDDEMSHARKVCLRTPVIVREILDKLPNRDLIKLSLVNKQWNFEARSVLKDRGTLTVKINSSHKDLAAFASDLRQMHIVPFAGMFVQLSHFGACRSAFRGSLHPAYDVILERLPFKKLSVEFRIDLDRCRDCPAFFLLKNILEDFGTALEKVTLVISREILGFLQQFLLVDCSFPRLKTLKLGVQDSDAGDFTKFVRSLVPRLPNLQELHIFRGKMQFNENVLEGSSVVLVPNRYVFEPLYLRVCESLLNAVRPTLIQIKRHETEDFNPELLNGRIPMMLQASSITLKTLRIDLLFALPLMCYGICLENVTELEIFLNCGLLERLSPGLLTLLKGFDFNRILPKLSQVEINNYHKCSFSPAQIRSFVEQAKVLLRRTWSDRATNIKRLKFYDTISDSTVPFLAHMFPDVKILKVTLNCDPPRIPFTLLWEHFKYLEELEVLHNGLPRSVGNMDSAFCGIFPEEIAELRKKDDDYIRAVNIVPVMPAITCMKDLKQFTFQYRPQAHKLRKRDPTFIFSKATGLFGFARSPRLAVAFESACTKALHHMKPYGSFTKFD